MYCGAIFKEVVLGEEGKLGWEVYSSPRFATVKELRHFYVDISLYYCYSRLIKNRQKLTQNKNAHPYLN
jgi:hypothetical protein